MILNQIEANVLPEHGEAEAALSLEGDFVRSLSFTRDELIALGDEGPAGASAGPFDLRCFTTNRFIRTVGSYRGVLLKELILRAGLRSDPPGEFKRTVFLAVAHDGYVVTFSWHELFNTPVGEQVLIAHACDGRPLTPGDGAPILFSGADILPAPRHVKRLARIVARVLAV